MRSIIVYNYRTNLSQISLFQLHCKVHSLYVCIKIKTMKNYLLLLMSFSVFFSNSQSLLKEFRAGASGSELFSVNYKTTTAVYFAFESSDLRRGIAVSDGTSTGSKELFGYDYFIVTNIIGFVGNDLIFSGGYINDAIGDGLYKFNIQTNTLSLIKDIDPNSTNVAFLVYGGAIELSPGRHIFIAYDDTYGFEPWITDGTTAGTYMIKDINPTGSSVVFTDVKGYFAKLNGVVYFGAANDTTGAELWRTDGTEAGTYLVKDILTDNTQGSNFGSNPAFLTTLNNKIYFSAYDDVFGRELWSTDGTQSGTVRITNFSSTTPNIEHLIVFNNSLYFDAYDGTDVSVFKSDGTSAGTVRVQSTASGAPLNPTDIFILKNKLTVLGEDVNGFYSLFTLIGNSFSKFILQNNGFPNFANDILVTSNYVYFHGQDASGNTKIYRTDESSIVNVTTDNNVEIKNYSPLFLYNNCLLFIGSTTATGEELYSICNQQTQPLSIIEDQIDSEISLYPNPTQSKVEINFSNPNIYITSYSIYDITGKAIQKESMQTPENSILIQFSDNLNNGYYMLKIQTANGLNINRKVLLNR